jgi:hypothetical protein
LAPANPALQFNSALCCCCCCCCRCWLPTGGRPYSPKYWNLRMCRLKSRPKMRGNSHTCRFTQGVGTATQGYLSRNMFCTAEQRGVASPHCGLPYAATQLLHVAGWLSYTSCNAVQQKVPVVMIQGFKPFRRKRLTRSKSCMQPSVKRVQLPASQGMLLMPILQLKRLTVPTHSRCVVLRLQHKHSVSTDYRLPPTVSHMLY